MYKPIQKERNVDLCVFPFYMYESERTASRRLLVLPSADVHRLKEKTSGFKPNGETPSEVKSTSFQSSFTLLTAETDQGRCKKTTRKVLFKILTIFSGF